LPPDGCGLPLALVADQVQRGFKILEERSRRPLV
jgi:hypothetical protein